MKQVITLGLAAMALLSACSKVKLKGEGSTTSETRSVSTFSTVQANGDVDVDIYPSTENKVVVTGYHNLVPVYETNVNDGKLSLKFRDGYINVRNNNIRVAVYTTQLSGVKVNGSGRMMLHDDIKSGRMDADVNGSGNIDIANNHYEVMDLHINGSGDINAPSCNSDKVYAKISGSGSINIAVNNLLDARISGSGDIWYWGNPETVSSDISGSGKIRKQ